MFGISALLILAVAAVLVTDWAVGPSTPPTFQTTVKTVRPLHGKYHVSVEVENLGTQAAGGVRVDAELEVGGEVIQADQMLDFISAGEETTVTFVFTRDPRGGRFSVAVTAFKEP